MRLGQVIGKVTLSQQDPAYHGGRFLLVQPWGADYPNASARTAKQKLTGAAANLVVYDSLGAGVGSIIGFTEGSEAAKPFATATPVDAYCAAIVDEVFYQPPSVALGNVVAGLAEPGALKTRVKKNGPGSATPATTQRQPL